MSAPDFNPTKWKSPRFGQWMREGASLPPYLLRLFERWGELVNRYCEATDGDDAPFWHNERANVGLLSAAAWQAGLISLEEYPANKGGAGRKRIKGRADLWIAETDPLNGDAFEAKYKALSPKEFQSNAIGLLDAACADVRKLKDTWHRQRFGLAFAGVHLSPAQIPSAEKCVSELRGELVGSNLCDAVAWAFPERVQERSLRNGPPSNEQTLGVFLLVRSARCAKATKAEAFHTVQSGCL